MNERKKPYTLPDAVQSVFWGYILISLHLNLCAIDILPDWLGYLFFLEALPLLTQESPSAALLRPLGKALAVWNGFTWVANILGGDIVYALNLIFSLISLYFHFQLLTELMTVAQNHQCSQWKQLGRLRTARTIILTIAALPVNWEAHLWVYMGFAIVGLLVTAAICYELWGMKKEMQQK
ncbi:MAG: hypothetical protein IJX52_06995 [Oscillibacter sp.]|nr:hypothetical protein [Oscillibacter sp.]